VQSTLVVPNAEHQFCCAGCASVYRMIHGCDLGRYYQLRDALGQAGQPAAAGEARYAGFDDSAFLDAHTRALPDGLRQIDLRLGGVHCAACVWLVERLPRVRDGVVESRLSLARSVVHIVYDPTTAALSQIAESLHRLGYPPHPAADTSDRTLRLADERKMLIRLAVAGVCAGNAMLLAVALYLGLIDGMAREYERFLHGVSLLVGLVALLGPGMMFFQGAWAGLRTRTATLDLPIALALGVGGVAGTINVLLGRGHVYFDSLCVLVFLLLVGRYLQMRQQRRSTDAVTLMQSLTPAGCAVRRGGRWVDLPLEAVKLGDRVRVPSNERLPVDGQLVGDDGLLNTASLSGEAEPVAVAAGDGVFAGSHNVGPAIELTVRAVGEATRLATLMRDAAEGVRHKPAVVQFADRVAGWFTVVLVGLAGVVGGGWWWAAGLEPALQHTVSLLIVACPCALGLATPLTLAMALGVAARRDILIKDAAVFEKLAAVCPARPGTLALDKTGTLTESRLRVTHWLGDATLQAIVGRVEREATHPVGRSLAEAYDDGGVAGYRITEAARGGLLAQSSDHTLHLGNARFLQHHGITIDAAWRDRIAQSAAGAAPVWIARNGRVAAAAVVRDTLRPDAESSLQTFVEHGWPPAILSGDHPAAVASIATTLNLPPGRVHAGLAPEDKPRRVRDYRGPDSPVLMIGDGVNDAAALAAADVGLAVHGGAEAALVVADAYTARPGLTPAVQLLRLSRHTLKVVRQNLSVSLAYNAAAVGLAAAGLLTPWVAAILMPLSSLSVLTLATARLQRWKG
jgi:Cu2+-exporting ATPase